MTLQSSRLSLWFRSQLCQKQHQILQTRSLNLFGFEINWLNFRQQPQALFEKRGRAVILDTAQMEVDDNDGPTLHVDLTIENDHAAKYNPDKDVIVRNYSSCLTVCETESMITAQRTKHARNKTAQHGVIGQTFAGTIEYIPERLKNDHKTFPYSVGDRVWGISPKLFGHCWSDYVPIHYKSIASAPTNIPLHYCGLYPLQFGTLATLLKFGKIYDWKQIKKQKIIFIGTGRRSMISTLAPLLKHIDANNQIIVIDDRRYSRLNEDILRHYLGVDGYHLLDHDDDAQQLSAVIAEYASQADIVVDSWAMDRAEIVANAQLCKAGSVYMWLQNHVTQYNKNVSWKTALQTTKYIADIVRDVRSTYKHNIQFVPNLESALKRNVCDEFSAVLSEMSFPILIDKMYDLDDVQNAFDYAFHHDDTALGEHIGVVIEKEKSADMPVFDEAFKPTIIKLPAIGDTSATDTDTKMKSISTAGQDTNANAQRVASVDDIIEQTSADSAQSRMAASAYGFTQNKTQHVESQTIAKQTSNKA